jgi:nicotinamide-nucleotide amidase
VAAVVSEIITIGDELLRGERVNTNAAFLGNLLAELSVQAKWVTVVGDDPAEMRNAFSTALRRSHVIVVSGGLGPTPDDRTKQVLSEFFDMPLVEDPELLAHVEERFQKRGMKMPEESRNQALSPVGARQIPNPFGTAAGIHIERNGQHLFALPGVPRELEQMASAYVAPTVREAFPDAWMLTKTLRLADIGESQLLHLLGDVSVLEEDTGISYLPHYGLLDLRLTARSKDSYEAEAQIARVEGKIREVAGNHVYTTGTTSLAEVIGAILVNRGQNVAAAESCTGGLVADMMTDVAGASRWLERGWVTYSNEAKAEDLGVDPQLIEAHGAVSEEVATAMADGARVVARTSWGLSSTGVAGPTGGSEGKPVGTVWIAVSWFDKTTARQLHLDGDRRRIKLRATHALLYLFYRRLMDIA